MTFVCDRVRWSGTVWTRESSGGLGPRSRCVAVTSLLHYRSPNISFISLQNEHARQKPKGSCQENVYLAEVLPKQDTFLHASDDTPCGSSRKQSNLLRVLAALQCFHRRHVKVSKVAPYKCLNLPTKYRRGRFIMPQAGRVSARVGFELVSRNLVRDISMLWFETPAIDVSATRQVGEFVPISRLAWTSSAKVNRFNGDLHQPIPRDHRLPLL